MSETAPNVFIDDGIQPWIENKPVDGILNRDEKSFTKSLLLRLIVRGSIDHFRLGIGMELNRLHPSEA